MHTLKITDVAPDGRMPAKFELTLDGFQIKGVTKYSITRLAGRIAALNLELNVAMELGDKSGAVGITHLSSPSRECSTGAGEGLDESRTEIKNTDLPKLPPPPLIRMIGDSGGCCPACGSSEKRTWFGLGRVLGCIQPECDRYYVRFKAAVPSIDAV